MPASPTSSTASRPAVAGFTCLFLSVIFNGAALQLNKQALAGATVPVVLTMNVTAGSLVLLAAGWLWRRLGWRSAQLHLLRPTAVGRCLGRCGYRLVPAAILGAVGGLLLQATIASYGPEMAAFLLSLMLVFLVLGGLLQGDRIRPLEWPAIGLIILGAFLFSYEGGGFRLGALGLMTVATGFAATKQLLVRGASVREPLPAVMVALLVQMALWSALLGAFTGRLAVPPPRSIAFAATSGLACNATGMILLYAGYRKVGVARGGPLNAMRPVVVLAIGLALGVPLPAGLRLLGGGLILVCSAALPALHHAGAPRPAVPPEPDPTAAVAMADAGPETTRKSVAGNPAKR